MEESPQKVRFVPDVEVSYEECDDITENEDKVAQLIRLLSENEVDEPTSEGVDVPPKPIDTKVQTVKRRKKRFPVAMDDPRKFYADNAIAAMLSGDINQYREVLERQHTEDCVWIQRHTNDTPDHPAYREIRGREKIIEFVGALMEINPDMVVHVSDRKLHICEDGTSYLVSKGTYTAMTISEIVFTGMAKRTRKFLSSINPLGALRSYFYGGGLHPSQTATSPRQQLHKNNNSINSSYDDTNSISENSNSEQATSGQDTGSVKSSQSQGSKKDKLRQKIIKNSSFVTSNHTVDGSEAVPLPMVSSSSSRDVTTSATTANTANIETNAQVSTPETKIMVVYDKNYKPTSVSAVISTVSYINAEHRIYKIESFMKVDFPSRMRQWSFGLNRNQQSSNNNSNKRSASSSAAKREEKSAAYDDPRIQQLFTKKT